MVSDNCFPVIMPEWVMRNDGKKVILYQMSTCRTRYLILDRQTALVCSLLDGRRRAADIARALGKQLFIRPLKLAKRHLQAIINTLNRGEEKVLLSDVPCPREETYTPPEHFAMPDTCVTEPRLETPLLLLVYFSAYCQTHCIYCYSDLHNMQRLNHMSPGEWSLILGRARERDIRMLRLCGGDPLGRIDSLEFITMLLERGFLFSLSTKCLVSSRDAARLADAGYSEPLNGISREIQVSIDSADPDVAEYLTGRREYLEKALLTVRNLVNAGIHVVVRAVLTPFNHRKLPQFIEFFSAMGVRHFSFSPYVRSHYRHDSRLTLTERMKKEIRDDFNTHEYPGLVIDGVGAFSGKSCRNDAQGKIASWNSRDGCPAGRFVLGIAPDGRAVLCEQMPMTEPYFVGDFRRQSIEEIWSSPELLEVVRPPREYFRGTACEECPHFHACIHERGYCFREAFFNYNRFYHPPPACPCAPVGGRSNDQ